MGDTFDLFDGALTGRSLRSPVATRSTANLALNGTVTVTGVLPPPTLSFTSTPTDITLNVAGGLPGGQLAVVSATNVAPRWIRGRSCRTTCLTVAAIIRSPFRLIPPRRIVSTRSGHSGVRP